MNDVPLETFQQAILELHGEKGTFVARHRVCDTFDGERVWDGEVLEFSIPGGSVFAWEVDKRITTVLRVPGVESPLDAVRASIAAANELA